MYDNLDFLKDAIIGFVDSQGREASLQVGAITYGTNNYPEGLGDYVVTGFDDFKQLEDFIEKFGGEAYHFRKRDGWQFWEKRGWANEAYTADDYVNSCGDNTNFADIDNDFISERLHSLADDFAGDGDFDPIKRFIGEQEDIKEALENANENESVIIHNGCSIDVTPNEMMGYRYDVWRLAVGAFFSKEIDLLEKANQ